MHYITLSNSVLPYIFLRILTVGAVSPLWIPIGFLAKYNVQLDQKCKHVNITSWKECVISWWFEVFDHFQITDRKSRQKMCDYEKLPTNTYVQLTIPIEWWQIRPMRTQQDSDDSDDSWLTFWMVLLLFSIMNVDSWDEYIRLRLTARASLREKYCFVQFAYCVVQNARV